MTGFILPSVGGGISLVATAAAQTIKDGLAALVEAAALQEAAASTAAKDQHHNHGEDHPGIPVGTTISNGLDGWAPVAVGDELHALVFGNTVTSVDLVHNVGDLIFRILDDLFIVIWESLSLLPVEGGSTD
jgi:hypothetical protein